MRGIAGLLIKDPIASISGTHGISHTRMATESANTTNGAHPFPRTLARACGKNHLHNLEPEDLSALTTEAAAMARIPLAGTNGVPGGV
ncbi:hypothetical protein [Hyphomicrobium sp.]|uniref:hypothetical protein n=1 Tax=Hyphomicrobium sp. TaxID=82 RepID=UPI002FE338DF